MFSRHRGYKTYHGSKPAKTKKSWSFLPFLRRRAKTKRLDYGKKLFRNPYSSKYPLIKRTKAPKTKIAIGLLALLGTLGILFFHPYFNITQIELKNLERISASSLNNIVNGVLEQKRWWFFNGHNLFLANTNKIDKTIKDNYALENLEIKTIWPRTLKISLKEKTSRLILQNIIPQMNGEPRNYYYLLDSEGRVIQEVKSEEIGNLAYFNLPYLQRQNLKEIKIGNQLISAATIEFLNFLQQKIPEKTKVHIASSHFDNEAEEGRVAHLTTTEGWEIFVDRQNDWDKQLQVLTVFLRDKIKNDRSRLHYIDVRYENRSYFQ